MTTPTTTLQPFRIDIADDELADLRDRLHRTRWPDAAPSTDGWDRGVPPAYLRSLAERWADRFDWRAQEAALNAIPQVITTIDGQTIHALHARSEVDDALPLLLLHSWPGSPVEFLRMVGPLTDPVAHGGDAADAFHVVIPSIPGFGYSTPVTEPGWSTGRIARAFAELMRELGYERYAVAGGDIGAGIAAGVSGADPDRVVAVHVTTDAPTAVTFASWSGDPAERPGLTADDKARIEALKAWSKDDEGYLRLQSTRPQTIGYALTDSPVAQLAWIVEKVQAWTDRTAVLPEDAVDIDQLLANVEPVLVHPDRVRRRALAVREHARPGVERARAGADRLRGVRHGAVRAHAARPGAGDRALDRVRGRRTLPGDGAAGPARR